MIERFKAWLVKSMQGRLTLASILVLPMVCGALAWTLDRAFVASLLASQQSQMLSQAYALIASSELEGNSLWLPEYVTDDRLNQLSSNTYAVVLDRTNGGRLWQSLSSGDSLAGLEFSNVDISVGEFTFEIQRQAEASLFMLHYLVEWEEGNQLYPFQFVIVQTQDAYLKALYEYRNTLWFWLAFVAISLVLLQLVILKWGFRPVKQLSEDLTQIREGKGDALEGQYPLELQEMTDSVNRLIKHETHQRERYRNTLADLAHSIKNPSAIIASAISTAKNDEREGQRPWLDDIAEQNARIDQILSYQLTRAVAGVATPFSKAIQVKPNCSKVCSAMQKVYFEKGISLSTEMDEEAVFRGDEGDLMELLGNLIDNAFKYGRSKVHVGVQAKEKELVLTIDDDGPGISDSERDKLIRRGQRADTSIPGQGIGLAVVNDIVENYAGELELSESQLGGLQVSLRFDT